MADRTDGVFTQQVAIKVLAQYLSGEDFKARLLDGGVSAAGEPFLVTEFVDGVSLDPYCDQQRLPIRDRVRIFLEVCAAFYHAH